MTGIPRKWWTVFWAACLLWAGAGCLWTCGCTLHFHLHYEPQQAEDAPVITIEEPNHVEET